MHVINLGDENTGYQTQVFGYMYPSDKYLLDGRIFRTWHGLKLWLLTGQVHDAYLRANTLAEIKAVGKHKWNYVEHLDSVLKQILDVNLRERPFHRAALRTCVEEIQWNTGKEFDYWKRVVLDFVNEYKAVSPNDKR